MVPKDPVMLLSYLNTQLRDHYPDFCELCSSLDLDQEAAAATLEKIGYRYSREKNQFVAEE